MRLFQSKAKIGKWAKLMMVMFFVVCTSISSYSLSYAATYAYDFLVGSTSKWNNASEMDNISTAVEDNEGELEVITEYWDPEERGYTVEIEEATPDKARTSVLKQWSIEKGYEKCYGILRMKKGSTITVSVVSNVVVKFGLVEKWNTHRYVESDCYAYRFPITEDGDYYVFVLNENDTTAEVTCTIVY